MGLQNNKLGKLIEPKEAQRLGFNMDPTDSKNGGVRMSSTRPRVVITGLGVVSPLGNGKESLWDALSAGRSGVRPLRAVPAAP